MTGTNNISYNANQQLETTAYVDVYKNDSHVGKHKHNDSKEISSLMPSSLVRSLALFFGLFSIANAIGFMIGNANIECVWWIDFRIQVLPEVFQNTLAIIIQFVCGCALVIWGLKPLHIKRANFAGISSIIIMLFALKDAAIYWALLISNQLYFALPVSLSALIALCMLCISISCTTTKKRLAAYETKINQPEQNATPQDKNNYHTPIHKKAAMLIWLLIIAMLFPVAQTIFYGSTDYRQKADVVVSFGAKVRSDGSMSLSLQERVKSAVELYLDGYVDYVLVSGGQGSDEPINEAYVMRDYAISLGVPNSAILVDTQGDTTQDTVKNSIDICNQKGLSTILADSSFYHMPRIKMMYMANGKDVSTVPAQGSFTWGSTKALLREIPAWWFYWCKYCLI